MCDQACNKCGQGCKPVTDLDVAEAGKPAEVVPPLTSDEVKALRSILMQWATPLPLLHEGEAVVPQSDHVVRGEDLEISPFGEGKPFWLQKDNTQELILAELRAINSLLAAHASLLCGVSVTRFRATPAE